MLSIPAIRVNEQEVEMICAQSAQRCVDRPPRRRAGKVKVTAPIFEVLAHFARQDNFLSSCTKCLAKPCFRETVGRCRVDERDSKVHHGEHDVRGFLLTWQVKGASNVNNKPKV